MNFKNVYQTLSMNTATVHKVNQLIKKEKSEIVPSNYIQNTQQPNSFVG